MSRSGYRDDIDNWQRIRWRGMVASSLRGKRGQRLLTDLVYALDAMPEKALVIGKLETDEGGLCALGAAGRMRGVDMSKIDPNDPSQVAEAFDIAEPLAQEIVYLNDERFNHRWNNFTKRMVGFTPEERWTAMHAWAVGKLLAVGKEAPK